MDGLKGCIVIENGEQRCACLAIVNDK